MSCTPSQPSQSSHTIGVQVATAPSVDEVVGTLAAAQYGVVARRQLMALGVASRSIEHRLRRGRLHVVHRAVYSVGHVGLSREARWMAAVLACGEGAVLTGAAAADLWGISRHVAVGIDVLVPRRHGPVPGIGVHQTRTLSSRDVSMRNGIPVTTVARTLVELADAGWASELLANLMHEAAFRRRLNVRALHQVMHEHRFRPGHRRLVEALEQHAGGSAGTKSGLEARVARLLRDWGFRPLVNVWIDVGGETLEVDALLAGTRVIIGVDGAGHERRRTRQRDTERNRLLRAAGYEVVRVTELDLDHDPHAIRRAIEGAVSRQSSSRRNPATP